MVTFDELLDEVGAGRHPLHACWQSPTDQTIDFDIELAKKQDNTNPVYYVQYAHARTCSILRKAAGVSKEEAAELGMDEVASRAIGTEYDLGLLTDPTEAALARKLSEFGGLIESCARDRAPFRLTHYAEELAAAVPLVLRGLPGASERGPSGGGGAVPRPPCGRRRNAQGACAVPHHGWRGSITDHVVCYLPNLWQKSCATRR